MAKHGWLSPLWIGLALMSGLSSASANTLVDLHSHLFMERGMNALFRGSFDRPLVAKNWNTRFASQINAEELENSGLGLVVVALYAHPFFNLSRRESIRRQIEDTQPFVNTHPDWILARTAAEARAAHAEGRRILILSLEGVAGVLENDRDIHEFVDLGGIRIVTFAHLSDDTFTGAALLPGYHVIGNPMGLGRSLAHPKVDHYGAKLNPRGLTALGRVLAKKLISKKVWIDLSHSPEASIDELLPLLDEAGQPPLMTHTSLREYVSSERQVSEQRLMAFAERGGVVGLAPSNDVLGRAGIGKEACPRSCARSCEGGLFAAAAQFRQMAAILGASHVFVGSDFNGAQEHLPPPLGCRISSELETRAGFFRIGQTRAFWEALGKAGAPSAVNEKNGVLNFIKSWAQVN